MSGKTGQKQSETPDATTTRGGKRAGSGRPRGAVKKFSLRGVDKMVAAAAEMAIERGKTLDQVLCAIAYDSDDEKTQLQAIRIFKDFTMVKESHKTTVEKKPPRSDTGLPEQRPDPALIPVH